MFIGFGYFSHSLFCLNVVNSFSCNDDCLIASSEIDESLLYHARLGQVNFRRMHEMPKDSLIPPFDIIAAKCKTCMLTKITKQPFPNVVRKSSVLELIHSDLCDFHATPSIGNKKICSHLYR